MALIQSPKINLDRILKTLHPKIIIADASNSYTIQNSMLVGYNELVNKGGGPQDFGIPADPKKLKYNSRRVGDLKPRA